MIALALLGLLTACAEDSEYQTRNSEFTIDADNSTVFGKTYQGETTLYSVDLDEDTTYYIEASGSNSGTTPEFKAYLLDTDESTKLLTFDDFSDTYVQESYTPTATGTYYLKVVGNNGTNTAWVNYSLQISPTESDLEGGASGTDTTTALTVSSTSPQNVETNVSASTTVAVVFSESILYSSISANTTDTTCSGAIQVSADDFSTCVQWSFASDSGTTVTLTPSSNFTSGSTYKIKVTTDLTTSSGTACTAFETSTGFTIQ